MTSTHTNLHPSPLLQTLLKIRTSLRTTPTSILPTLDALQKVQSLVSPLSLTHSTCKSGVLDLDTLIKLPQHIHNLLHALTSTRAYNTGEGEEAKEKVEGFKEWLELPDYHVKLAGELFDMGVYNETMER